MSELLGWLKINDLRNGSRLVRSTMPNQWQMLSSSVTEEYDHAGSSECDFAPSRSISTADSGMGRFVCSIGTPGRWRQGHTNIILNDARATGRPCGGTLDEDHCACQV